jgi:hypothetical protein
MRPPLVHNAFVAWLEIARSRLDIAVEIGVRTRRHIDLSFDGINPAIGAFLTSQELTVFADWQGQNWDSLLSLDVMPRRSARGYVCECCKPEERTVFPDLEGLWRDHLFEPFLQWVNAKLACTEVIGLHGSPSSGVTRAELLRKDEDRRSKPDLCLRVRL